MEVKDPKDYSGSSKKLETSKLFLFLFFIVTLFIVGLSSYLMIKFQSFEPLSYLIPALFAELGAATGCYYWKSRAENKIKIILGAVREIALVKDITEEQVRIVEALVNTLG